MRIGFLPESLFGRLFLAIVAVVAATLLIILALILRERREFALLESGAGSSLSSIAETVEQLASLPREEREREVEELRAQRRSVNQMRRARLSDRQINRAEIERAVVERLQRKLGDGYQVRALGPGTSRRNVVPFSEDRTTDFAPGGPPSEPPRDGFGASGGPGERPRALPLDRRPFELEVVLPDGHAMTFRMPMPRPGPPLPRQIFIEFGVLTLVLSAVLYLMTRTIVRPLGKLAVAADAVGRGERVDPLPEEGGRELQAATRAFNSMQERLRRYLDSRTRVLAAMSHDLRTPLTRLRLRVESIEDEALRARCEADLDEMSNMIRGALAVFRGLNDDEAVTPIEMNALLASLRDEYIEVGGIVTLTGSANAPYQGKPLALKRCLGNLINNAIQYGSEANVSIEDGDTLVIRVRDRGPGVPPELLEQVFEPFFRLESSRSRDTGGTGLGLSIARDIAQAHGGSIALRNLEHGLEATLNLPR
jgi:signal transduction histidine kinase